MKLKSLLKNKNFLYFVLLIAVVNTFGYLMMRETDAVMLFALVGFLTSYFTKNMTIVLLTAIVVTNVYAGSIFGIRIKEGMEGKDAKGKDAKDKDAKDKDDEDKEGMPSLAPGDFPPDGKKPKIDPAETMEAAYDHLDKLLDSGAIDKMSSETQNLAAQQDKLMKNIDRLEPMLASAEGMMSKMSQMGGMQERLTNMMGGKKK
jgi:hypothetical protein